MLADLSGRRPPEPADPDLSFVPGPEGLRRLAFILRRPDLWPRGFTWNFASCESCAMGLARTLWFPAERPRGVHDHIEFVAQAFGIPQGVANELFHQPSWLRSKLLADPADAFGDMRSWCESVTPRMVADSIDRFLALFAPDA